MIAVTQIRHAHSEGRGYYDRKIAEGHTARERKRALKRHISDRVFQQLRLDARTSRSGRTTQERLSQSSAAGQSLEHRHFGSSHSRTQRQR